MRGEQHAGAGGDVQASAAHMRSMRQITSSLGTCDPQRRTCYVCQQVPLAIRVGEHLGSAGGSIEHRCHPYVAAGERLLILTRLCEISGDQLESASAVDGAAAVLD